MLVQRITLVYDGARYVAVAAYPDFTPGRQFGLPQPMRNSLPKPKRKGGRAYARQRLAAKIPVTAEVANAKPDILVALSRVRLRDRLGNEQGATMDVGGLALRARARASASDALKRRPLTEETEGD